VILNVLRVSVRLIQNKGYEPERSQEGHGNDSPLINLTVKEEAGYVRSAAAGSPLVMRHMGV